MDTSQWSKLNKRVKISYSNRKFYKKYLYKLVYTVPGCVYFSGSADEDQLINRMEFSKRLDSNRSIVDYTATTDFYKVYISDMDLKFRSERSTFSIFGTNIDELYKLASEELVKHTHRLDEVSLVRPEDMEYIEKGNIVLREHIGYRYKVTLRDGYKTNSDTIPSLGNYLTGLGDEIKIGKQLLNRIKTSNKYLSAGYFYVNDPRIVDMIRLIDPLIIRYCQEIVINPK